MAKSSGTTRATSLAHTSVVDKLKNAKDWFIRNGMTYYDDIKNEKNRDLSDMRNLSETDKTYLIAYLSRSYRVVNDGIRNDSKNEEIKAMTRGIDRAISKLDSFQGTVYRAINFEYYNGTRKQKIQKYEDTLSYYKSNVGKEITEKAYTSTGKIKSKIDRKFTSYNYPSIKFTIDSKTGKDVSRFNDEEREVLFKRNSRFRVISVRGANVHLKEV